MRPQAEEKDAVALITGASRGLGFETCRQLAGLGYRVVLTARDELKGRKAVDELAGAGEVVFCRLDTTDPESIRSAVAFVVDRYHRLDVLVNNAGVLLDREGSGSVLGIDVEIVRRTFEVNTLGPLRMIQAAAPLLRSSGRGRVVNVSSGMGQLSDMGGGYCGYRLSKTALNAVTRIAAQELGSGVLVNSVCPGWVQTDMGGPNAPRPLEKGVETIVWLATLPDGGPSGQFFRDKQVIPW